MAMTVRSSQDRGLIGDQHIEGPEGDLHRIECERHRRQQSAPAVAVQRWAWPDGPIADAVPIGRRSLPPAVGVHHHVDIVVAGPLEELGEPRLGTPSRPGPDHIGDQGDPQSLPVHPPILAGATEGRPAAR
jgi:hypothetical protein